jgi:hypothetical protein
VPLGAHVGTGDLNLGDVLVPDPRRVTVRLLAPACDLMAVGPLGTLGLTIVRASKGYGVYWLELPEPGMWAINAECAGATYALDPAVVAVPPEGPELTLDAHLKSEQAPGPRGGGRRPGS